MKDIFKNYLFGKHILVSEGKDTGHAFETLCSLASFFGIRVGEGRELAQPDMIKTASACIGRAVPAPFYQGFPESVKALTTDQLLFDQLLHYTVTYGFGDFSQAGHSVFEEKFERLGFKESTELKDFKIISEEEALAMLGVAVKSLLLGTRPLSLYQYDVVREYTVEYGFRPEKIASKDTAVRLLIDTADMYYAGFLALPDVIKVLDTLVYIRYNSEDLKKLKLKNHDRKIITGVIDTLTARDKVDINSCLEKKKIWNGLLHHIHYKAVNKNGHELLGAVRGKDRRSAYSRFEAKLSAHDAPGAAEVLVKEKGAAAMLRRIDHISSRCEGEDDVSEVLDMVDTGNSLILLQLLLRYEGEKRRRCRGARVFKFTKHCRLRTHIETREEVARRRSVLPEQVAEQILGKVRMNLVSNLKDRLGRVYIDPDMSRYAVPLQESTSSGGFGVLARGSRIALPASKKLRAFTYWEKVDDIDLSVFGLDEEGHQTEFSWRTMASHQSQEIVYSGDETSGFYGGSEYFDIDTELFKERHPEIKKLIFCNNVFSGSPFSECICRAGYMNRDRLDSGEIYEPKTVETAFTINCNSTEAFLFAVDLETNELIWLNMAQNGERTVAGDTPMFFLTDYMDVTKIINMKRLFEMMASRVVDTPEDADVIVTNKPVNADSGAEIIREYDFEEVMKLIG